MRDNSKISGATVETCKLVIKIVGGCVENCRVLTNTIHKKLIVDMLAKMEHHWKNIPFPFSMKYI